MANINIIALNGHMGSGKDTLGRHLENEYNFYIVSLAKPLYLLAQYYYKIITETEINSDVLLYKNKTIQYLNTLFTQPVNSNHLYDEILAIAHKSDLINNPDKPRSFLQNTGQILRSRQGDVLVKALFDQIFNENQMKNITNFVITDLRTKEEIDDFKKYANQYSAPDNNINLYFIHILVDIHNIILRIGQRDGVNKNSVLKHLNHQTEGAIDLSYFNYIIDGNAPYLAVITELESIIVKEHLY